MTLDARSFEAAIVRHCSPTLAGIKAACLFNVPGMFAADANEEVAVQFEQWRIARELSAKLDRLVVRTAYKLADSGVCIQVIAHRHCGALIYVWRPELLRKTLAKPEVAAQLEASGYPSAAKQLRASIIQLGRRLENCQKRDPSAAFPHEIGFFLDYPFEDVMGFIKHNGQDYLCCGCWKVYSHPEQAEACFERYKRCTRAYGQLLAAGVDIAELPLITIAA